MTPTITTYYRLRATDDNGCTLEDEIRIFVDRRPNAFVPNVFSPNDDGINDRLQVFADNDVKRILSFQIFNRWGDLVYEGANLEPNDPGAGWDGTFRNQPLNPDIFVFYLLLELQDGRRIQLKGDVLLTK